MKRAKQIIERLIFDRPIKIGTRVANRYEICSFIGQGSYGLVYKVKDHELNDICVLKQARRSRKKSYLRSPFHYERISLQKLVLYSYFPNVREEIVENDHYFLAEDIIEGKTFEEIVFHDHKMYSVNEAFTILQQLLEIVEVMHENQIVHRDLRLPNIIVNGDMIKVIDFGLSRSLVNQKKHVQLNSHQCIDEKPLMREIAPQSDLYALGHTTLFLLYSSFQPHNRKEESWEEELTLPNDAVSIIRKLLQRETPYRTASEARREVEAFLFNSITP
ncbi:serine/threonine protein kinase [Bacillus solimangrovi]|uniref:Protein kinase domain-containing protein n=1 Tax=Bacillus solimangrovi TaxID=1305675 RepID=A0A1E5LF81_9BACI|nr:protein kinase [Bacillus solimangrovi]OEH92739.1 hypothetical protein BFG57_01685 [Bacillus solimangrovi]